LSPFATDMGEKRREIIKEWIKEGKIDLKEL
jgi:polyhydroxyalkanoate synthesis regulator phasin